VPIDVYLNVTVAGILTGLVYGLMALGLSVIFGVVRVVNFAHGEMMTGLPGYRTTAARPTGRTIFQALADLRLIPAHDGNPATIPKPAGIQARLLDLLDIDISRPRWLIK